MKAVNLNFKVVSVGNYNTEAYEEDDKNVLMDYFNEDDRNGMNL